MPHLEIKQLALTLGGREIIGDISLQVDRAEIICLLGPSGVGKTSLLRLIAGFLQPSGGEILLHGRRIADSAQNLPVDQRSLGMVFQDFALFPHLSVKDNITFGIQHQTVEQQAQRLRELVAMLSMESFIELYPHQLSGGQQQRVAIARALAPRPELLLLDEPFASLDVELRELLARELRDVLKQSGVTALMVCHNQSEAFAMADRIGVINNGSLAQIDTPLAIYHEPQSEFVASFIGEGKFLKANVQSNTSVECALGIIQGDLSRYEIGQQVHLLLRPDDVLHDDNSVKKAIVRDKVFRGRHSSTLWSYRLANKFLAWYPAITIMHWVRPSVFAWRLTIWWPLMAMGKFIWSVTIGLLQSNKNNKMSNIR